MTLAKTEEGADSQKRVTIFWSWQDDSPGPVNREFIQDCLQRAAKELGKVRAAIISLDRDTRGVAGSPEIAATILGKVRSSDVFVFDSTLYYSKPRASPNPNVMLELGYALAALGDSRVIGVMNSAAGAAPKWLPFDLKHRRWPLLYALPPALALLRDVPVARRLVRRRRAAAREALVPALVTALDAALKAPKEALGFAEHDIHVAAALWAKLHSSELQDWHVYRRNNPQYEERSQMGLFTDYIFLASRPENQYQNEELRQRHDDFMQALSRYRTTIAHQMVPTKSNMDQLVLSVKRYGEDRAIEDYDKKYGKQVDDVIDALDGVWNRWCAYVEALAVRVPEVVHS